MHTHYMCSHMKYESSITHMYIICMQHAYLHSRPSTATYIETCYINIPMLLWLGTWDNTTASRKRTRTKRYNEESWQAGRHTPNTGISSKATLPSAWRDRCTTPVCCQLWHMVQRHGHWPNKHRTNLRPHRQKWKEVCSTSHTKTERPTSGSGRGQKS